MVGAIVGERELAETIMQVSHQMGQDVPCVETTPEGLVGALRLMEPHGVKALISSGRLCDLLKSATSMPVIPCNPSSYDLTLSMARARAYSSKIAFLYFGELPINLGEMEDCLGVSIGAYQSGRNAQEVRKALDQVRSAGYEVLVSGGAVAAMARGMGLSSVAVRTGNATVRECIDSALDVVRTQQSGDRRSAAALAAVESTGVGLMVTERDGTVLLTNSSARDISGAPVTGKAQDVLGPALWDRLVPGGSAVATVGDSRVVVDIHAGQRAREFRTVAIFDPPVLRRYLAMLSEEAPLAPEPKPRNELVVASSEMKSLLARTQDVARGDSNVLVFGEPGSGRRTVAFAIHSDSRRQRAPFFEINAMLPDNTVLFDLAGTPGSDGETSVLERASGGTVYIHECWNLSLASQRVVLEASERGMLRRQDGSRIPCDVRFVLGSSRSLREFVDKGEFLPELYHAAASCSLRVPPLRERQEDIYPLLESFLKREGVLDAAISPSLRRRLLAHHWPGNCTELQCLAARLASLYRTFPSANRPSLEKVAFDEIESEMPAAPPRQEGMLTLKPGTMQFLEEQILEQMDRMTGGNRSEMARRLGVSRTTLWKKMLSGKQAAAGEEG
jgi:DNA-binding NtrC family response regulator